MVVTAIMKDMIAIIGGRVMCRNRSPVLSACQAFIRMAITAIKYGGVVKRRVSTLLLPRPATTLHNVSSSTGVQNAQDLRGKECRDGSLRSKSVCGSEKQPDLYIPERL